MKVLNNNSYAIYFAYKNCIFTIFPNGEVTVEEGDHIVNYESLTECFTKFDIDKHTVEETMCTRDPLIKATEYLSKYIVFVDETIVKTSEKKLNEYETVVPAQVYETFREVTVDAITTALDKHKNNCEICNEATDEEIVTVVDIRDYNKYTFDKAIEEKLIRYAKKRKALMLYGLPGGGKTVWAGRLAYLITGVTTSDRIEKIQFSETTSYANFMTGQTVDNGTIRIIKESFLKLCDRAAKDLDNDYVLIIDELNRGNLANILGEMLNMIEDRDTNIRTNDGLYANMPSNIIVIATLNSGDSNTQTISDAIYSRFGQYRITGSDISVEKLLNGASEDVLKSAKDMWDNIQAINEYLWEEYNNENLGIGPRVFKSVVTMEDLKDQIEMQVIPYFKRKLRNAYSAKSIENYIEALEEFIEE